MQKIPYWLLVTLWTVTLALFVVAAFPSLTTEIMDVTKILIRFIAPTVLLSVCILVSAVDTVLETLQAADLETWVFMGAVAVTGVLFIAGIIVSDKETRDTLQKSAFSVGGFAVGLRVGGKLDQPRK